MKLIIILLGLATVGLVVESLYLLIRERSGTHEKAVSRSLQAIQAGITTTTKKAGGGILRVNILSKNPVIHKMLAALPFSEAIDTRLEQAHIRMLLDRFLLLVLLSGWIFSSLVYAPTKSFLFALFGFIFGIVIPWFYVIYAKRRRMAKISEQLPEALDTIVRSLRAGHALSMAFEVVSGELPSPISTEFAKIKEENKLGVSLKDSMESLMQRCDNMDIKLFVTSVLIQWEVGGNLTEILNNLSYTIRERFKLRGHIKALTGEGRLSGLVLGVLPLAVGLFIYYLNPGYFDPLLNTVLGKQFLAAAVVLVLLGALVIKRIISIEI